jgi:NAD(P)-dependent dehydrogenase (short-subunit alcohol dehydrogenase family)
MVMAILVLVTGATDGIGLETAKQLAERGAQVIVHGRNPAKLEKAAKEIGGNAQTVRADFARLTDVRAMVAELEKRKLQPDVLVNNAGIMGGQKRLTADGFEETMQVNHLAPFLLTHLMLAGPSGAKLKRIVNVASQVHSGGEIDLNDVGGKRGTAGYSAYSNSKLANVLFSVELAERLRGRGITVNSLHPGVVATNLLREGFGSMGGMSPREGAKTSVYLAISPEVEGVTGKYFVRERESSTSGAARDRDLARKLYEKSAELVSVPPISAP